MQIINNQNELLAIMGGLDLNGTIINAFSSGIKTLLELGRSLGTAIRRVVDGSVCTIK